MNYCYIQQCGEISKKICNEISQIHKIVALTGSIYIILKQTNKYMILEVRPMADSC